MIWTLLVFVKLLVIGLTLDTIHTLASTFELEETEYVYLSILEEK